MNDIYIICSYFIQGIPLGNDATKKQHSLHRSVECDIVFAGKATKVGPPAGVTRSVLEKIKVS